MSAYAIRVAMPGGLRVSACLWAGKSWRVYSYCCCTCRTCYTRRCMLRRHSMMLLLLRAVGQASV